MAIKKYEYEGKTYNIESAEIETLQKKLDLTEYDAVELWLCDNDSLENEEQEKLDSEAKKVKIDHAAAGGKKGTRTPRTVKISDEKQSFFGDLTKFLADSGYNYQILKENKLISVQIAETELKIDLIQTRKPKK